MYMNKVKKCFEFLKNEKLSPIDNSTQVKLGLLSGSGTSVARPRMYSVQVALEVASAKR